MSSEVMTAPFDSEQQEDGTISIVVSPVQLAAVLESSSISEGETLSSRIWGAVGLVGGTLELLGSAALLVDPDPTVSKVVGAVGLVHGSDVVMTSWSQLISGKSRETLTAQAVTALAEELGLDPRTAATAGAIVDIMVPTGVAAAVARSQGLFRLAGVTRVRAGYISLTKEEQLFGNLGKASAHTLRDHVGKTMREMLDRFRAKPSLDSATSFRTVADAEAAVSEVLMANKWTIRRWVWSGTKKPLRLSMRLSRDVGEGVLNPAINPKVPGAVYGSLRIKTATVVLNKTNLNGRTWYVLTAYPDLLRDLGLRPM